MFDFKTALQAAHARLTAITDLQDTIYGLQEHGLDALLASLRGSRWVTNHDDAANLANTIVFAARANPSNIETYGLLIDGIVLSSQGFVNVMRRSVWRELKDPSIQFLTVQLLKRGIITPQFMRERIITAANPTLDPELGFYFFPEWASDDAFFEKCLEVNTEGFAAGDAKYTSACEMRLNGRDLSASDYELFKALRSKGQNHNPIAEMLVADDSDALTAMLADPNAIVPLSIFDRRKQGRSKPIRLIEYCALHGSVKCFKALLSANADIGPRVPKYAAMNADQEIIDLLFARKIPLAPAIIGGIKGYHFSLLKELHENQHIPLLPKAVFAMCQYKHKGLLYLLSLKLRFGELMARAVELESENTDDIGYEHILFLRAAELNDRCVVNIVKSIEGFTPMAEINQRFPTSLHAAAACNSVEVLRALVTYRAADINREVRADTPLTTAIKHNAIEAIEFLRDVPTIDPNRKAGGCTPLMVACSAGSAAACRVLVTYAGIDAKIRDPTVSSFFLWSSFFYLENCKRLL
jgi:hypothetical protein